MISFIKDIFTKESLRDFIILGLVLVAIWFLYGNDALNERIDERVNKKLDSELYFRQRERDSINAVMQAKDMKIQALEMKSGGGK